jgi:hypothetical protein
MLLPYITKQFSFEKKPIYMIRNPFAVVASQLKHPGWKNADSHFEIPTGIYNEVYDIHAEFLKTLQTKEEVLTAEWALSNKVVLNHSRHNKDWIFITYEQTLINPKQTLIKILAEWNCSNLKLDKLDFNRKSRTSLSKKITPVNVQLEHWKSSFTSLQIQKMQDVLRELVKQYNEINNKYNEYKKKRKPLNKSIKSEMKKEGLHKAQFDNIVVSYSVRERSSIEEEKLLTILKEKGLDEFIVVTEKPDVELLEEAILANKVDASILSKCVKTKEIEYLTVNEK